MKQFGHQDLESEDEGEVPVYMQKAKDLAFDRNEDGVFVLPDMGNYKTIREKQRVVRGYIGAVYRTSFHSFHWQFFLISRSGEFTDHSRASFPYILAAKDGQRIYSPDCVPEGFTLSDPDHLTGAQIFNLCLHWSARQQKGLAPFIILNPGPNHSVKRPKMKAAASKGKKKEYVDVSDDEENDNEEDARGGSNGGKDGEQEMPLKVGPPRKKRKVMFKSTGEDPSPVAGLSKLPARRTSPGPPTLPSPVAGPSKLPARRTSPGPPTLPDKVKPTVKEKKGKLDPDQVERPATRSRTKEPVTKGPVNKVSK